MRFWREVDAAAFRISTGLADSVRDAVEASIDIERIIKAWNETYPTGATVSTADARAWAAVHIALDDKALKAVLRRIYATGYSLGQAVSISAYAHLKLGISKAAPSAEDLSNAVSVDWSSWTPGNNPAQLLVRPSGGLARLLDNAGVWIGDFGKTTINRIGTKLADALNTGATDTQLAASLKDLVRNPLRALTIANTEMNRAMSAASVENYKEFGVDGKEWLAFDTDDDCADNSDQGVIPVDADFGSGDDAPPAHPNCRCAILPAFLDDEPAMIELALKPDVKDAAPKTDGVPGPAEQVRAISRLEILPNPNEQIPESEKWVESPWEEVPMPTVDPNRWDNATLEIIELGELYGTDPYLSRKKVKRHIVAMGQALSPNRSFPMVVMSGGRAIIVDGHHRLMAVWLLGRQTAAVWLLGEK